MVIQQDECEHEEWKLINNVSGYTFYKVKVNGKCQFDEFEKKLRKDKNIYDELKVIYTLMCLYRDNPVLPITKFRQMKLGKRPDIYEFKSKHIRVYVIKKEKVFYVIRAGLKTDQDQDKIYIKNRYSKVYLQD